MGLLTISRQWAENLFSKPSSDHFHPVAIDQLSSLIWMVDDPDEILRKAGKTRVELRKVHADDEVATACETREAALLATPWRLEPGEGRVTDLCWSELEHWGNDLISIAWRATLYGYSVGESIWWQRPDGRWGIQLIDERPFEWFTPQRDGQLRFHPLRPGTTFGAEGELVDIESKFFLTRNRPTWRQPRGEALLSRLYWPWFLRSAGWRFWARFLERSASPILLGKSGDTDKMLTALSMALASATMAVGKDDDVTHVPPGKGEAFEAYSREVDKRIQKAVLGQTLTTDVGKTGSFAAAKVQDMVRNDRRIADIRLVTKTVQRAINAVCRYNFPGAEPPTFVMEDATGLEIERAERDEKLAKTGQVRFTKAYFINNYEFEEDEIEVVEKPSPPAIPPPAKEGNERVQAALKLARSAAGVREGQDALDHLGDQVIASIGDPIDPKALKAAIEAATDPADLIARLDELAADLPEAEFLALTERALFAAEVLGYAQDV